MAADSWVDGDAVHWDGIASTEGFLGKIGSVWTLWGWKGLSRHPSVREAVGNLSIGSSQYECASASI